MSDYQAFLRAKIKMASFKGFTVEPEALHEKLYPHQRDIVRWAVQGGNRAVFAKFGLGKSIMQCEWLRQIIAAAGGLGLIVCPLGVRQELIRDAAMLGVRLVFIRSAAEIVEGQAFYITNYETVRDGKLDPALFTAVSLDEASVLRSFGSKTYQEFLPLFEGVRFKLVNTATPSPNRFKELIHYAGFLGVMDTGQALTRFFQRDSEKAGNLTLYPHKAEEFWLWVSSWAVFVQFPSDLGYSDEGYALPELEVVYHEVPTDYSKAGGVPVDPQPAAGAAACAEPCNPSCAEDFNGCYRNRTHGVAASPVNPYPSGSEQAEAWDCGYYNKRIRRDGLGGHLAQMWHEGHAAARADGVPGTSGGESNG